MWVEFISSLSGEVDLADPVDESELASAELALGLDFPAELKSFLREANGVSDEFGCEFVWPAAAIVSRNREMRDTAGSATSTCRSILCCSSETMAVVTFSLLLWSHQGTTFLSGSMRQIVVDGLPETCEIMFTDTLRLVERIGMNNKQNTDASWGCEQGCAGTGRRNAVSSLGRAAPAPAALAESALGAEKVSFAVRRAGQSPTSGSV
ncbi:SMI1/KNR4 family protein [Streptomyces sp. NPDC004457]